MITELHYHHANDDKMVEILKEKRSVKEIRATGSGYCYMVVILGEADGMVISTPSSSRWDLISGNVMVNALGGKTSGVDGFVYAFEGDKVNLKNTHGMIGLSCPEVHKYMTDTFAGKEASL